jgi:cell division protein FtsW
MFNKQTVTTDLNILISICGALIIIGMLFIYSSSSVFALSSYGSSHYFVQKQIIGLLLGAVALFIAAFFPLELLKKFSPLLFLSSLALTSLTLVGPFALRIHGSSRWLSIGGFGMQPSELLKISLIMYLSYFFAKKSGKLTNFWNGYFPFLTIIGITSIILLGQPDFGMTVTLAATSFMLFFIITFNVRHVAYTIMAAIPLLVSLILFKPYRFKRIMTFLNPWDDPQGAGFQIIQSLIAIGSGNWLGMGISHSKQKFFYLPMQHTDFIFSIIAEETGFIGATLLIMLYMLFLYIGMKIAWQLEDPFSTFMVLGFVLLISLQTLINLCVATGMVPTTGIGLPFVSYGNSALIVNLIMMGLIMNAVRNNRIRY